MRRFAIFTAGAALVLGSLAIPGMAVANGRTVTPEKSTTIAAQSVSLDTPIAAQGKGHGKGHGKGGHHNGYRRGYRHGYSDSRYGYGHGYRRGGSCYGCDGPGSRCYRGGCDYAYPGYYGGGYGCGYDYQCGGQPYQYNCSKYTGPDGKPPAESGCKYDQKCDCYYHSSQPPAQSESTPGPDQNAQPAPDQGQAPPPDQGAEPAPEPGQGEQPRPY